MTQPVSIVIPNWNGAHLLDQFMPSVIAAARHYDRRNHTRSEIIVVDDASTDESIKWLIEAGFIDVGREPQSLPAEQESNAKAESGENRGPAMRFIGNPVNNGFGPACNQGVSAASNRLVFLLNNDVEVSEPAIEPLVENFKDPSVFAAHCRVFDFTTRRECGSGKLGGFSRGFLRVHRSYAVIAEPAAASGLAGLISMFAGGGSAMFDREKFMEIGAFDPIFRPFYWEDVELSYRAWKRGYTVKYEPRSITCHMISSTIGKLDRSHTRRIQERNRLMFNWIHLHGRGMLARNLLWVLLLGVTAPFRLRPGFLISLAAAVAKRGQIRERRSQEKQASFRSDTEVLDLFRSFADRPDIRTFDDRKEESLAKKQRSGQSREAGS